MRRSDPIDYLQPVSSRSRREAVIETLRRATLVGGLAPGERVIEVSLSQRLGVSRVTLREALRELVHEGLLVQRAYQGTYVAAPDERALMETAEVRTALEKIAILKAPEHDASFWDHLLAAPLSEMERAARADDQERMHDAHMDFHGRIYAASDNRLLQNIWASIRVRVEIALTIDQSARSDAHRLLTLHRRFADVISQGKPSAIEAEIEAHIRGSAEQMLTYLQRGGQRPNSNRKVERRAVERRTKD